MAAKLRVFRNRRRRGVTLMEMVLASGVMVLVLFALAGFTRFQSLAWRDVNGDYTTADQAKLAIQKIDRDLREARSVVTASSSATQLAVQKPAYDGSGNLVVPLQDGAVVSFYLADASGVQGSSGSVLWRSANGVPDQSWSLQNGKPRYVLATGGLTFGYSAAGSPAAVTVSLTTQQSGGTADRTFVTSQVILLRNAGL